MCRRMRKSKKATIGGPLVDFYSYLAFVLVVIVFFLIFTIKAELKEDVIGSEVEEIEGNNILLGFLKTPIVYEETSMTMHDMVVMLEEEIIDQENNEKKTYRCADHSIDNYLRNNEKCEFLKNIVNKMFEKKQDDEDHNIWLRVSRFSNEEIKKIKSKDDKDFHLIIDGIKMPIDVDISIIKPLNVPGSKCLGQVLDLYDKSLSDKKVIVWICKK